MNKNYSLFPIIIVNAVGAATAPAQQPKKVFHIGYLWANAAIRRFGRRTNVQQNQFLPDLKNLAPEFLILGIVFAVFNRQHVDLRRAAFF